MGKPVLERKAESVPKRQSAVVTKKTFVGRWESVPVLAGHELRDALQRGKVFLSGTPQERFVEYLRWFDAQKAPPATVSRRTPFAVVNGNNHSDSSAALSIVKAGVRMAGQALMVQAQTDGGRQQQAAVAFALRRIALLAANLATMPWIPTSRL